MSFKAALDHFVEQVDVTIHSSSREKTKPVSHIEFIYNCRTVSHQNRNSKPAFRFHTHCGDGPVLTVESQHMQQRRQQQHS
jgi:hypothetical protein